MADRDAADTGDDELYEPPAREKPITVRRRVQLAEQLASKAVAAELEGDHKTAADLYRRAIDALTYLAEAATAAVNDSTGTDDESG